METLIDWGVSLRALKGQRISGDFYLVESSQEGFLIAAIDGLGHGPQAAAAAQIAADTLRTHARDSAVELLNRCHQELKQTRGVAMSLASFNTQLNSLWWLGVGNVEGVRLRLDQNAKLSVESIPLRGGVVGYQLPPLRPSLSRIEPHDTIIFATDGIQSAFIKGLTAKDLSNKPQQLADHLLAAYDKGTDDSLVLVVRYLGCGS
ncbi:MAG: SpoIIE family protein phosphatase [Chloroflexota bacterium]